MSKEKQIKGNVIIDPNAKPETPELMIQCLFGKTADTFISEIISGQNKMFDDAIIGGRT